MVISRQDQSTRDTKSVPGLTTAMGPTSLIVILLVNTQTLRLSSKHPEERLF